MAVTGNLHRWTHVTMSPLAGSTPSSTMSSRAPGAPTARSYVRDSDGITITLIGVQTSVAAHVLTVDPERLDRKAVAQALDDIAGTCRSVRGELRTTLEVLRAPDTVVGADLGAGADSLSGSASGAEDMRGPLPGIDGLAGLVEAGRVAGAEVELSVRADGIPPSVGVAAYRIVQEALPTPYVTVAARTSPCGWVCGPRTAYCG